MGPPSTKFYDALRQQSVRHAVLAMLVFSIVALITNLCLPYLISTSDSSSASDLDGEKHEHSAAGKYDVFTTCRKRIRGSLTLSRAWMISHIITAFGLFGETIGDSFMTSVLFVSLLGISWTLTQWAPFAIISAQIALSTTSVSYSSLSNPKDIEEDIEDKYDDPESVDLKPRAGITMAIQNVAIATPQIFSAVITAFIFWGCRQFDVGETEAMRWVLRLGILAGGCAAWCARKLW